MWYSLEDGWVILSIKAQPAASRTKFAGILGEALKVTLAAPAVEGAANKELVKFLSKSFKVPKSDIEIVSGAASRTKRVRLPRTKELEDFIKDLDAKG
jgi:uncharacterized protein (TIGR00251 family)